MLKALGDTCVNILYTMVNKIYDSGEIPIDMLKFVFIALPKKPNTLDCDQHRTISLMSHTLKLLLKIVLERCRSKIRPEIAQCQYGFMPDKGTRNAIFTLRMLSERSIQHQQNLYICFIDYKKAFDRVRHKRLFKMLKDVGLDEKDQRIIYNLYHLQKGPSSLQTAWQSGLKSIVGYVKAAWWVRTSSTCTANTYSDGSRNWTTESPSTVSVSTTSGTQMTRHSLLIRKKAFKGSWTSFWMLLLTKD